MGADNPYFRTLELFAYDNYQTYVSNKASYMELKTAQVKKLKMITIVDLAQRDKMLSYSALMTQLEIQNIRDLEDLIIDCMYNDLLSGKLDQLKKQFHVVHTYGRDVRASQIDSMLDKLRDWEKQLKESQELFEKNVNQCNTSIT